MAELHLGDRYVGCRPGSTAHAVGAAGPVRRLDQPFAGVFAHGFEHAEARLGLAAAAPFGADQALVNQRFDATQRIQSEPAFGVADLRNGAKRETTDENAQPPKEGLLGRDSSS